VSRAAAIVIPLALIAAACGEARTAGPGESSDIAVVPPSKPTTLIVGGTPKQRDVLEEILSGLGLTRLESVEIVTDLEKDWGAPPDAVGYGAKTPHGDGYAHWQGEIAGEVFARRSVQLGLPPVAYIADESSASAPGRGRQRAIATAAADAGRVRSRAQEGDLDCKGIRCLY
jgi:hypothetical protein